MSTPPGSAGPAPGDATPPPTIDSRSGFADAVLWGLQAAADRGARQVVCASPDFDAWPLDDPAWQHALQAWLRRPARRLVLLAARFDEVPRRHPRFTRWRREWVHAMATLAVPQALHADLPTLLVDDGPVLVHLADPLRWRGHAARDPAAAQAWRQTVDALVQQSEPAFPVTSLGL
jgi:hypothetical protein